MIHRGLSVCLNEGASALVVEMVDDDDVDADADVHVHVHVVGDVDGGAQGRVVPPECQFFAPQFLQTLQQAN